MQASCLRYLGLPALVATFALFPSCATPLGHQVDTADPALAPAPPFYPSVTEVHVQLGELDRPTFAGGGSESTTIVTLQHYNAWEYGDNFFFVDFLTSEDVDGFNDRDAFAKWFPNVSLGKVFGLDFGDGLINDVSVQCGFIHAADANVVKYLPGISLGLNIPGLAVANLELTGYVDDSGGVASGGAPSESDTHFADFNWIAPFAIGQHEFSFEGHVEYAGERTNEFGQDVEWTLLAQPQFRYDLGKTLYGKSRQLFVGVEYQHWINKLGDSATDESATQFLVVWRF